MELKEEYAYHCLKWGHLVNFSIQIIMLIFRTSCCKNYCQKLLCLNFGRVLEVFIQPLSTLAPTFYSFFLQGIDPDFEKQNTFYREWLYIEIHLFLLWVYCTILFLAFAYLSGFRGNQVKVID